MTRAELDRMTMSDLLEMHLEFPQAPERHNQVTIEILNRLPDWDVHEWGGLSPHQQLRLRQLSRMGRVAMPRMAA